MDVGSIDLSSPFSNLSVSRKRRLVRVALDYEFIFSLYLKDGVNLITR